MRPLAIHNGHPRLRFERRAVAAVIHALDEAAGLVPPSVPRKDPGRRLARHEVAPKKPLFTVSPAAAIRDAQAEISIAFLTDAAIARLHGTFLDDPTPTDVITFEGAPHLSQAGEICVSVDTAAAYAARHGHAFSEELTLYLAHGWLHLAGYDDLKPEKKRRMRAAEKRALELLASRKIDPRFTRA